MGSDDTYRKLRIFVASPSDVAEEKARLINTVARLQKTAQRAGFFLELKEWRDIVPDMGRPQQVIFDQSDPQTWDIFIGILWQRFGSRTGATVNNLPLESGTHEEFLKAYELWKAFQWPRILFYRCVRSQRLDHVDSTQLAKIENFFAEFEAEHANPGIYKTFATAEEFDHLTYDHINELIRDQAKPPTLKIDVEKAIVQIVGKNVKIEVTPAKTLVMEAIEEIEKLYETRGSTISLPTGFTEFDRITGGLHGAEMTVIAAPPGMGKTAFAMNVFGHIAIEEGKAVAFFSLETNRHLLMQRLLCSRARVNLQRVRNGFLSERDFPNLMSTASKLATAEIYIVDTPRLGISELRVKALELKLQQNIQLIVIDNLQLLHAASRRANEHSNMSEISSEIKILANELELPIILLAQLNRQTKYNATEVGRSSLADLQELGALEQNADVVGLLFRTEYYETDDDLREQKSGEAELIITKQRNGPTGSFKLTFLKEFSRFENRALEATKE